MRRQELKNWIQPSEKAECLPSSGADRSSEAGSRFMLTGLAILSLMLMFASRAALAEANDFALNAPLTSSPAALSPALSDEDVLFGASSFPEASPELTVPSPSAPEELPATQAPLDAPVHELGALLSVRATPPAARAGGDTDASIAAAVAEGSRQDLEPKKAFRKKNFDLFRTEHEVEILRNDMLLRLRLRAKSRETMSVELRF